MAERQASDQLENATLHDVVEQLEEGDEFEVYAGEYIVDEVIECEARPMVRVRKKSVGGWMQRTYRLEWEDPTDEDDETLVIKTKYKSHWDVYSTFQPEDIELEDVPAEVDVDAEESEPVLVTDGGQVENETEQAVCVNCGESRPKYEFIVGDCDCRWCCDDQDEWLEAKQNLDPSEYRNNKEALEAEA